MTKTARIDLRLTDEQRRLLDRAASICGSTVASYSVASLMDCAARTVAQAHRVVLSDADFDQFMEALDAPDDEAWLRLRNLKPVWAS